MWTPEAAARVLVMAALRDGKIIAPSACELCGHESDLRPVHPDPTAYREAVWLGRRCRRRVRAGVEPIPDGSWLWPGVLRPTSHPADEVAAQVRFRLDDRLLEAARRLETITLRQPQASVHPTVRASVLAGHYRELVPDDEQQLLDEAIAVPVLGFWEPFSHPDLDASFRAYAQIRRSRRRA